MVYNFTLLLDTECDPKRQLYNRNFNIYIMYLAKASDVSLDGQSLEEHIKPTHFSLTKNSKDKSIKERNK